MEIKKKLRQLSRTQIGVSLTKEDREILDIDLGDIVGVNKHSVLNIEDNEK